MLHDEQELLDYITENYSDRKSPAKKEWTFQVIFSYLSSTVSIGFSLGLSPVVIAGEIDTILTSSGNMLKYSSSRPE